MDKLRAARPARRLVLAAALGAALLGGAELGLRAAKVGSPAWHRPDPLLGWTLRPYAGSHGGARFGEVNAFGQRDNPHEADKRAGVYRIAVLGDERSEALDLPLRATWWRRLAIELDRCGFAAGQKIEVLNFGVGGYNTAQESIVLETAVMRYRPDLVLLQFSTGKDIRENSRLLATRVDRPFYSLDGQGRLRLDSSFRDLPDFDRRSQFRYELAREISDRSRVLQVLTRTSVMGTAHAEAPGAPEPPHDARWEEAWRVTEAIIARMHEFAQRNGARFAVTAVPGTAQSPLGRAGRRASCVIWRPLRDPRGHGRAPADRARVLCHGRRMDARTASASQPGRCLKSLSCPTRSAPPYKPAHRARFIATPDLPAGRAARPGR